MSLRNRIRLIVAGLILVSALIVGTTLFTNHAAAAVTGPSLNIDATAGNHAISPYIYGMNFADSALLTELHLPVNRWGGNATSRYNYQTDVSNHAMDWYFENIKESDAT